MKYKLTALVLSLLVPFNALAEETALPPDGELRANFKRVALEMSSTSVDNAEQYKNSPNSQLSADSETVIKGVFDFTLEYEKTDWQWNNSVYAEYGKTTLKPAEGEKSSTENADKILLTSDYNRKMWKYEDADVGPFASLGYQTEFTANNDAPRTKTFRAKEGIKMFNGKNVKELYVAPVQELDLTYSSDTKLAYEIGFRGEYPLREGVKFQIESYFRDYVYYSTYRGTDFEYEFNLTSRMDVKLNDTLSLAPYITYFRAQDRQSDVAGSNFMIGLSLAYSDIFNL